MTKIMNDSVAPLRELIDVQSRMLEELTRHQFDYTCACIDLAMKQGEEWQKCKTPVDLISLQHNYAQALEKSLRGANEQNLRALQEARAAMERIARGALTGLKRDTNEE
ncbi:phasin family protein [Nitrincola tapanii]|nr:phasin family protein [Nitrincola tapanii]